MRKCNFLDHSGNGLSKTWRRRKFLLRKMCLRRTVLSRHSPNKATGEPYGPLALVGSSNLRFFSHPHVGQEDPGKRFFSRIQFWTGGCDALGRRMAVMSQKK